jgi:hypothetical protein
MMQGDGFVSLLVCLAVLLGLVTGLRFNVRMLVWLCLAALVCGAIAGTAGFAAAGRTVLTTLVSLVALQVGYFVALVIGAMRLAEIPAPAAENAGAGNRRGEASRPTA